MSMRAHAYIYMNDKQAGIDTSSSTANQSSMDEASNGHHHRHRRRKTLAKAHSLTTTATNPSNNALVDAEADNGNDGDDNFESGGSEMWSSFNNSFNQVQSVLDRNRVLIQQVNENHQSKIHDNMVKNVALIQEINDNISKVVSLYSDLSVNFSSICHEERGAPAQSKSNSGKSSS